MPHQPFLRILGKIKILLSRNTTIILNHSIWLFISSNQKKSSLKYIFGRCRFCKGYFHCNNPNEDSQLVSSFDLLSYCWEKRKKPCAAYSKLSVNEGGEGNKKRDVRQAIPGLMEVLDLSNKSTFQNAFSYCDIFISSPEFPHFLYPTLNNSTPRMMY